MLAILHPEEPQAGVRCDRNVQFARPFLARAALRQSPLNYFRQTHGVIFSIRYRATASSAANVKPTFTDGADQTNEGADQTNC